MLRWALVCLVVALVAGLVGLLASPGPAAALARLLFGVLLLVGLLLFTALVIARGRSSGTE